MISARAQAGRIDDRYAAFGVSRASAQVHDLQDALQALLHGQPPAARRTAAVGCTISD